MLKSIVNAPSWATTTCPCRFFLFPRRYIWFHDRERGVLFARGPEWQPLPHRYMRIVQENLPEKWRDRLPERYQ